MKTVERIEKIKNFVLRKKVMGPVLVVLIGFSCLATGYENHVFDKWVASTNAVSSANSSKIVENTKAIEKLQTDIAVAKTVEKPPIVIVKKVIVTPKRSQPAEQEKPHGVLTKLKNFLF